MTLTWLELDIDYQEGEEKSFSAEYRRQGNLYQLSLYLPFYVIQIKTHWQEQ